MVRIYNDYVVLVDMLSYTAAIDTGKDGKDGRRIYKNIGYYGTLRDAVRGIARYDVKKNLKDADVTLIEACAILNNINEQLEKSLLKVGE